MEVTATQAQTQAPHIKSRQNPVVFWKLTRFALRDYLRTPWVFLNLAILVAVHTLFFKYNSGQGHFFAVEYTATILQAAITTTVLFGRANRAESYAILAHNVARASYTGSLLFAAWLVAAFTYLVSALVNAINFSPMLTGQPAASWETPTAYAVGSLPVLLIAAFVVCLVALLSSFVSSSPLRLGLMTAIALLVMSFDNRNFPIESLRPLLQGVPPVLAPLAGALKYATEQDNVATVSLGLLAGYTLLMLIAALTLSSSRDLVLD